jgi:hypothetical protein
VVSALGYRSGGPRSIPGTTRKKIVGLKRGPLSLVSTTEELLDIKVAAPVWKTEDTAVEIRQADYVAPSICKTMAITSPTSGCRSVDIFRLRTQAMEFSFFLYLGVFLRSLLIFYFDGNIYRTVGIERNLALICNINRYKICFLLHGLQT